MPEITETTELDSITEVESLLNDVGFRGDFETVSRPLMRRLVEEVKTNRETLLALKNCKNKPVCGHCNALLRHATKDLDHD